MIDCPASNNRQIAGQRLGQGRFTCPVRSDDSPVFIALDLPGGSFENKPISQSDRDLIKGQEWLGWISLRFAIHHDKKGLSSSRDTMPSLSITGGSSVTSRTV